MADYMNERAHGKPEGLADRLENWAARLGTDKLLPWVGLGLIDDLKAAAEAIAVVEKHIGRAPMKPKMEFDL